MRTKVCRQQESTEALFLLFRCIRTAANSILWSNCNRQSAQKLQELKEIGRRSKKQFHQRAYLSLVFNRYFYKWVFCIRSRRPVFEAPLHSGSQRLGGLNPRSQLVIRDKQATGLCNAVYLLMPPVGDEFNLPGAVRGAPAGCIGAGCALGGWCMATMMASAGFLPTLR